LGGLATTFSIYTKDKCYSNWHLKNETFQQVVVKLQECFLLIPKLHLGMRFFEKFYFDFIRGDEIKLI